MELNLDIYMTVAVAIGVFYIGQYLKSKIGIFQKYCIPAPVIGGVLFAVAALFLRTSGILLFTFDVTLQNVFMNIFFTTIGFTASFKLIKKGGLQLFIFLGVVVLLVVLQNILGVTLATLFQLDPMLGLAVGSVPMVGGHGTAGSFGPLMENTLGVARANTVAIAAATFGLVAGGIIGGPVARRRIKKHNLTPDPDVLAMQEAEKIEDAAGAHPITQHGFMTSTTLIFVAMGIGSIVFNIFKSWNITLPTYIGAMIVAAIIRNVSDMTHNFKVPEKEIEVTGTVSLSLFLSMALMTLKLWELAELAGPLVIMLLAQTILMVLFAYYVTFNVMGRDYEAAVLASANCGFGLGATPNAIANMDAICGVFGPAPKAFFIVPLVGGLFIDFFNTTVITIFLNVIPKIFG